MTTRSSCGPSRVIAKLLSPMTSTPSAGPDGTMRDVLGLDGAGVALSGRAT